jgi:hypothetical protein
MALILTVGTELTPATDGCNPLDAGPISNLPKILHVGPYGNDNPGTFVAGNALGNIRHLEGPFVMKERLVRGTKTRVVDFDKNLVWAGLRDGNFLYGYDCLVSRALLHRGFLRFGKIDDTHYLCF